MSDLPITGQQTYFLDRQEYQVLMDIATLIRTKPHLVKKFDNLPQPAVDALLEFVRQPRSGKRITIEGNLAQHMPVLLERADTFLQGDLQEKAKRLLDKVAADQSPPLMASIFRTPPHAPTAVEKKKATQRQAFTWQITSAINVAESEDKNARQLFSKGQTKAALVTLKRAQESYNRALSLVMGVVQMEPQNLSDYQNLWDRLEKQRDNLEPTGKLWVEIDAKLMDSSRRFTALSKIEPRRLTTAGYSMLLSSSQRLAEATQNLIDLGFISRAHGVAGLIKQYLDKAERAFLLANQKERSTAMHNQRAHFIGIMRSLERDYPQLKDQAIPTATPAAMDPTHQPAEPQLDSNTYVVTPMPAHRVAIFEKYTLGDLHSFQFENLDMMERALRDMEDMKHFEAFHLQLMAAWTYKGITAESLEIADFHVSSRNLYQAMERLNEARTTLDYMIHHTEEIPEALRKNDWASRAEDLKHMAEVWLVLYQKLGQASHVIIQGVKVTAQAEQKEIITDEETAPLISNILANSNHLLELSRNMRQDGFVAGAYYLYGMTLQTFGLLKPALINKIANIQLRQSMHKVLERLVPTIRTIEAERNSLKEEMKKNPRGPLDTTRYTLKLEDMIERFWIRSEKPVSMSEDFESTSASEDQQRMGIAEPNEDSSEIKTRTSVDDDDKIPKAIRRFHIGDILSSSLQVYAGHSSLLSHPGLKTGDSSKVRVEKHHHGSLAYPAQRERGLRRVVLFKPGVAVATGNFYRTLMADRQIIAALRRLNRTDLARAWQQGALHLSPIERRRLNHAIHTGNQTAIRRLLQTRTTSSHNRLTPFLSSTPFHTPSTIARILTR